MNKTAPLCAAAALPVVAIAFMALAPLAALAQPAGHHTGHSAVRPAPSPTAPAADDAWLKANANVADYPRGHIDVLRWEKKNLSADKPDSDKNSTESTSTHSTPIDFVSYWQSVLQVHRAQQQAVNRLGPRLWQLAIAGALSPDDRLRVQRSEGAEEALALYVQTQNAWYQAIALDRLAELSAKSREIAAVTLLFKERQRAPGNIAQSEVLAAQVRDAQAAQDLLAAQRQALDGQEQLARLTKRLGLLQPLALPPELPMTAPWQQELSAKVALVNLSDFSNRDARQRLAQTQWRLQKNLADAQAAYRLAQESTSSAQALQDETVLRYNGMLLGTDEVLAAAQTANAAQMAQQRQALSLAQVQLDALIFLAGFIPEPSSITSWANSDNSTSAKAD